MNKKLILIILIGLMQIGNIFCATKRELLTSSSSELNEDLTSDEYQKGKKVELTTPQEETLKQLKTTIGDILPLSILELTAQYADKFTKDQIEKANKDLLYATDITRISHTNSNEKIKEAIENGADIHTKNRALWRFAYSLSLTNSSATFIPMFFSNFKMLIEDPDANVDIEINGTTPLSSLLDAFTNILYNSNTLVDLTSKKNQLIEIIELLLKKGANPNRLWLFDSQFKDLLIYVSEKFNNIQDMRLMAKVINLLLDYKADFNTVIDGEKFIDILNELFKKQPKVMQETMSEVRDRVMKLTSSSSSSSSSSSTSSASLS